LLSLATFSGLEVLHRGTWYCSGWIKMLSRENQNIVRKTVVPLWRQFVLCDFPSSECKRYWKPEKSCCGTRVDVAQWLMCLDCKDSGNELQAILNVCILVHVGCIVKDLGLQAPQKKISYFSLLTFVHHALYIWVRRTVTPRSTLFIYLVNIHI